MSVSPKKKSKRRMDDSDDEEIYKHKKKDHKRPKIEDDYDAEEDVSYQGEEEEPEHEAEGDSNIAPPVMQKHVKNILHYLEQRKKTGQSMNSVKKVIEEWLEVVKHENKEESYPDSDELVRATKKFLRLAIRSANLTVDLALRCIDSYLGKGITVITYPDFPTKPMGLLNYYAKKKGINAMFGKAKEAREAMMDDHAMREECEHELEAQEKKYLADLESFLEQHPDLLDSHRRFLAAKIRNMKKKIYPETVSRKSSTKSNKSTKSTGGKRKEVTAFDLFCRTKKDKYADLDEETRRRKLLKKFNKLPDDKKIIFEQLALSN